MPDFKPVLFAMSAPAISWSGLAKKIPKMLSVCVVIRGELLPIVESLHRVSNFVKVSTSIVQTFDVERSTTARQKGER